MSKLTTLVLVIAAALGVGCTGRGTVSTGVYASSGGGYSSGYVDPSLVEIESGVWVVEGYDQPVFYSDNYYWLYRDGIWLRSSYYNRGFVVVNTIPYRVRTIRTPTMYVRYRATYGARVRQGPRGQVIVRDHRQEQIRENRQDNRQEARESQQDRQEARRENRQDNREEARESQQDRQEARRENRQENAQEAREHQQEVRENKQENKQEAREAQQKREQAARDRKKDEDDKKRLRRP